MANKKRPITDQLKTDLILFKFEYWNGKRAEFVPFKTRKQAESYAKKTKGKITWQEQ